MRNVKPIKLLVGLVSLLMLGSSVVASQKDDTIELQAKESYVFKTYLKNDEIKVKSIDDGNVTLSGRVAEDSHKLLALETVRFLPGVKNVKDELKVTHEKAAIKADNDLRDDIKLTLMLHQFVSASETTVRVKKGVVTLGGTAQSEAQKELTGEYVNDVVGVKEVNNNIKVGETTKGVVTRVTDNIDDASITAQIKVSLLFHRSTSAVNTSVDTKNGVVTLTGTAKNGAEKELVTKRVEAINGVKTVVNNMTL